MLHLSKGNSGNTSMLCKRVILGVSSSACFIWAMLYLWKRSTRYRTRSSSTAISSAPLKSSSVNTRFTSTLNEQSTPKKLDKRLINRYENKSLPNKEKRSLITPKKLSTVTNKYVPDLSEIDRKHASPRTTPISRRSSLMTSLSPESQCVSRLNYLVDSIPKDHQSGLEVTDEKTIKIQNDLEFLTVDMLDKFQAWQANKRLDMMNALLRLSELNVGKKYFDINKLAEIVSANFSSANENLFDKYAFDNKMGELDTDILLVLLKLLNNLSASVSENLIGLKNFLDHEANSMETLVKQLCFYLIELDKHKKQNLKRFKKIEAIKFYAITILNNFVAYLNEKKEANASCKFLHQLLFNTEPIAMAYDESKLSYSRNSLKKEDFNLKKEIIRTYLKFLENLLNAYKLSGIEITLAESQQNNFISFLLSDDIYNKLKDYGALKISEIDMLIDSIINLIIEIKEKYAIAIKRVQSVENLQPDGSSHSADTSIDSSELVIC